MSHPKVQKTLTPGRLLIITHKHHKNKLALLLNPVRGKQVTYKVLVLNDNSIEKMTDTKDDLWYYMLALTEEKLYSPMAAPGHEILIITGEDIFEISGKSIKVSIFSNALQY